MKSDARRLGAAKGLIRLAQGIIILAVPIVLALLPVRMVAQPWLVRFEYGRPGFPPDVYGMGAAERERLALVGLDSIVGPLGMEALDRARFDDGRPAFTPREISHMLDVRVVIGRLFLVQVAACVALAGAAVGLRHTRATRLALAAALRTGALLTLLAVLGVGVFVLAAWNSFFTALHQLFFASGTWLFAYSDTLIRLYPVQFWIDVAVMVCAAIIAEAAALGALATWWLKRA